MDNTVVFLVTNLEKFWEKTSIKSNWKLEGSFNEKNIFKALNGKLTKLEDINILNCIELYNITEFSLSSQVGLSDLLCFRIQGYRFPHFCARHVCVSETLERCRWIETRRVWSLDETLIFNYVLMVEIFLLYYYNNEEHVKKMKDLASNEESIILLIIVIGIHISYKTYIYVYL